MAERWKTVPGHEEYAVSTSGRVRRTSTGKVLTPWLQHGYEWVHLSAGAKSARMAVHRVVLTAFVCPKPAGMECRHLNGQRRDNRLVNLTWGTKEQNELDRATHGTVCRGMLNGSYTKPGRRRRGESHGCAKLTEEDVVAIRADTRTARETAQDYPVSMWMVKRIRQGKNWHAAELRERAKEKP